MKYLSISLLVFVLITQMSMVWAEETQSGITLEAEKGVATTVPATVNYQGRLLGADGKPLSGTHALSLKIYTKSTDGDPVWGPQVFASVPVVNGHFNIILGPTDTNGLALADVFTSNSATWLQVTVDNAATPISPRQKILSVPYAVQAEKAAYADKAAQAEKAGALNGNANTVFATLAGLINFTEGGLTTINDLKISIQTTGVRPVLIMMVPRDNYTAQLTVVSNGANWSGCWVRLTRDNATVGQYYVNGGGYGLLEPSPNFSWFDNNATAGSHSYEITIGVEPGNSGFLSNVTLVAMEL